MIYWTDSHFSKRKSKQESVDKGQPDEGTLLLCNMAFVGRYGNLCYDRYVGGGGGREGGGGGGGGGGESRGGGGGRRRRESRIDISIIPTVNPTSRQPPETAFSPGLRARSAMPPDLLVSSRKVNTSTLGTYHSLMSTVWLSHHNITHT